MSTQQIAADHAAAAARYVRDALLWFLPPEAQAHLEGRIGEVVQVAIGHAIEEAASLPRPKAATPGCHQR